jgi:hypothetical protein
MNIIANEKFDTHLCISFQLIMSVQIMKFHGHILDSRSCCLQCISSFECSTNKTNYVTQTLPYKVIHVIYLFLSKRKVCSMFQVTFSLQLDGRYQLQINRHTSPDTPVK